MSYQQSNSQPFGYPPTPEQYQEVPPPNKRSTPWLILITVGTMLGFFLGLTIGYAAHTAQSNPSPVIQAATQDTATVESQPTSAPTSATSRVGAQVTSGIWLLTINSAKTSTGTDIETPRTGNIYLVIIFTAKNTDVSNRDMNPFDFDLRDAQGTTYQYTAIDENNNPDGTVVSGQQLRGELVYEVPKSLHTFTLQFDPPGDLDNSQIVQWTITK